MNRRDSVLWENLWHELKAIREGQEAMAYVPRKLDAIDNRLRNVETDVKAVKAVLSDHSRILKEHSRLLSEHSRILNTHSSDIAELKQALV